MTWIKGILTVQEKSRVRSWLLVRCEGQVRMLHSEFVYACRDVPPKNACLKGGEGTDDFTSLLRDRVRVEERGKMGAGEGGGKKGNFALIRPWPFSGYLSLSAAPLLLTSRPSALPYLGRAHSHAEEGDSSQAALVLVRGNSPNTFATSHITQRGCGMVDGKGNEKKTGKMFRKDMKSWFITHAKCWEDWVEEIMILI